MCLLQGIVAIFLIELQIIALRARKLALGVVVGEAWPNGYAVEGAQLEGQVIGNGEAPIDEYTPFRIELSYGYRNRGSELNKWHMLE